MYRLIQILLAIVTIFTLQSILGYNPIFANPVETSILGLCLLATDYKTIPLQPIPIAVSQSVTLSLPIGKLYSRLHLWLSGTIEVTGGTPTIHPDACASFLNRIEVIASAPGMLSNIKDFPGRLKVYKNALQEGITPQLTLPGVGVAVHPFSQMITIPFITLMSINRLATLLDSRQFKSIDLKITFGPRTDLLVGVTTVDPIGFVYPLLEVIEPPAEIIRNPILVERYLSKLVTALDANFNIPLTRGAMYKSFFTCITDNSIRNNALATDLRIVLNETDVKRSYRYDQIQAENVIDYKIAPVVGCALSEQDPDGDLDGMINSALLSELALRFNMGAPTGVARAEVVTDEIINAP